jgi:hypothetical protein
MAAPSILPASPDKRDRRGCRVIDLRVVQKTLTTG